MLLLDLFEDEATDQSSREEAEEVHDRISRWLSEHEDDLEEYLNRSPAQGGCFFIPLRRIGMTDYADLILIFAPPGPKSAFGTIKDGRKVIILAGALIAPYDLRHLPTRFGVGSARTFRHEFMHYLLSKRRHRGSTSARSVEQGNLAAYYNEPDELNAYYQEAASEMWRIALAIAPYEVAREKFMPMTTSEWVQYALQRHFDKDFVESLTPQNLRRIKKRLARFIEQTIKPIFSQTSDTTAKAKTSSR